MSDSPPISRAELEQMLTMAAPAASVMLPANPKHRALIRQAGVDMRLPITLPAEEFCDLVTKAMAALGPHRVP